MALDPRSLQKLKIPKRRIRGERGNKKEGWAQLQGRLGWQVWGGRRGKREGSSEPGLAHVPGLLQIVTPTPAIRGDFPENGEHGVPDSVSQSWDVIWCQPFCGDWGQHTHLTSPGCEAALLLAVEVLIGGHDYGDNGNLGLHCKMEGATFEGQHGPIVISCSLGKNPDPHVLGEQGLGDLRHDTDGIPCALPVNEDDSC